MFHFILLHSAKIMSETPPEVQGSKVIETLSRFGQ
jgi:hypothetical protein